MTLNLDGTIVAVSSGLAPAQRGIVRISGTQTRGILDALLLPDTPEQESAKQTLLDTPVACCQRLPAHTGLGKRTLDLWCYFWPDGRSFTGEPCAELHLLGSLPIVESLVERVCSLGARPADRGEFTLRSFLAGRIDLTQAEAVLGVIEADTDQQLERALGQLSGNLSQPVRGLRNKLVELTAHVEAGLDFVEEDIQFISAESLLSQLADISVELDRIILQLHSRGSRVRPPQVVLVGAPNAGKSSLFNALLGRDRVIVSEVAGTTRDVVSERITIGKLDIELVDTAGIEELSDATPRALAQDALNQRLRDADVVLFCVDASIEFDPTWLQAQLSRLGNAQTPIMLVGSKSDLLTEPNQAQHFESQLSSLTTQLNDQQPESQSILFSGFVTANDSAATQGLAERIAAHLQNQRQGLNSDAMHRTMVRCSSRLTVATESIARAQRLLHDPFGEELVAVELRIAIEDLSSVIGEVHTEDILGEIFSRFCIGK